MFFQGKASFNGICGRFRLRRLISSYIDGQIAPASRIRLESHLQRCRRCNNEFERLRFASLMVASLSIPEGSPTGMPAWSGPGAFADHSIRGHARQRWAVAAGVTAVFILAIIFAWRYAASPVSVWSVAILSGNPLVNSGPIMKPAQLKAGDWIETDQFSSVLLGSGLLGQVQIEPGSRVRFVKGGPREQRLNLVRGRLAAAITAPPRIFLIETPSGTAVDLGCSYTIEVDQAGSTLLQVTSGWVAIKLNEREIMVPAGAFCQARPGMGPGTPYFASASEKLQEALVAFDFESGGSAALHTVLSESTKGDCLTLLNLLRRVDGTDRELTCDRIIASLPLPSGVTRDGVLRLDDRMMRELERVIGVVADGSPGPVRFVPALVKATGPMLDPRYYHKATLLGDGNVLITGGLDNSGPVASAEIYRVASGEFVPAGNMASKRAGHTATRLADGRVLIAGGSALESSTGGLSDSELFDPAVGTFHKTGSMHVPRDGHQATLLADGRVLITGGLGRDPHSPWLASAEIYDPSMGLFIQAGDMTRPRADHKATLLKDGKVLITGGFSIPSGSEALSRSAEVYDPVTNSFSPTGTLLSDRFKHSAILLEDGRVIVVGGIQAKPNGPQPTFASAELYDPRTGVFSSTGNMTAARFKIEDSAVLLRTGKVLVAGGGFGIEVYDPNSGEFGVVADGAGIARFAGTATLLSDGRVLIVGGAIAGETRFTAESDAWICKVY